MDGKVCALAVLAIRPAAFDLDVRLARKIADLPPVASASLLQGSQVLGVAVPKTKLRALPPGLPKTALIDLDQHDIVPPYKRAWCL